jgi:hypothetical protein
MGISTQSGRPSLKRIISYSMFDITDAQPKQRKTSSWTTSDETPGATATIYDELKRADITSLLDRPSYPLC